MTKQQQQLSLTTAIPISLLISGWLAEPQTTVAATVATAATANNSSGHQSLTTANSSSGNNNFSGWLAGPWKTRATLTWSGQPIDS